MGHWSRPDQGNRVRYTKSQVMEPRRSTLSLVVATLVFLACFAQGVRAQTVLVPAGADWKYLVAGSDQGTAWRALGFDDSSWAEGPAELGYGDTGEATVVGFGPDAQAKFVTTYFRHAFNVDDVSVFTNFLVRLVRDDGAIVYLNGVEIFRSNMPEGDVSFSDLAPRAVDDVDETNFFLHSFLDNHLSDGPNVLAVEVHQVNVTSSDLGFNLELLANFEPVPPTIAIAAPTEGEPIVTGNILIAVDAQYQSGSITSVEVFEGETSIGALSEAPFFFPWIGVTVGDYTLTAHVETSLGLEATSDPVDVSVIPVPDSTFVPLGDTWKYLDDGSDQGRAWRDVGFEDSSWAEAPAPFGYGYGDEATVVGFGSDADNKFVTTRAISGTRSPSATRLFTPGSRENWTTMTEPSSISTARKCSGSICLPEWPSSTLWPPTPRITRRNHLRST